MLPAYLQGDDAQGDLESHLLRAAELLSTCHPEGETLLTRPACLELQGGKKVGIILEPSHIWGSICSNSLIYPYLFTTLIFKASL